MRPYSMIIIFSLLIVTLFGSFIYFRDTITSTGLKWYLERYCHQCWGPDAKLYIASIEKNEDAWVIKKPMITKETDQKLLVHFAANQITIDYSLALLKRQLNLDVKVDGLKLNVYDQNGSLEQLDIFNTQLFAKSSSLASFTPPSPSFLNFKLKFESCNGTFSLYTPKNSKSFPFSFKGEALPARDGGFTIWLQEKYESFDCIDVVFLPANDTAPERIYVGCDDLQSTSVNEILKIFKTFGQSLDGLEISDGVIIGGFTINLPKDQGIYLEGFLKLFEFEYKTKQLQGDIPNACLEFSKPEKLDQNLTNCLGKITFPEPASLQFSVKDHLYEVENIVGDFIFQLNGAEIALQGYCWQTNKNKTDNNTVLIGNIKFALSTAKDALTLEYVGESQDFISLLPEKFINAVSQKFQQNRLAIIAKAGLSSPQMKFEGTLTLDDDELVTSDTIHFDLTVAKTEGFSLDSFKIVNGNFNTADLPLEKYASPFIFPKNQLQLSGQGTCTGKFDDCGISLQYQAKDLLLNSDYFALKMEDLTAGSHYFEFDPAYDFDRHLGSFPLWNAEYLEKNSGLVFTGIQANVSIETEDIHIDVKDAFCKGMYFAGAVDIDFKNNSQGVITVDVIPHAMEGSFLQFQSLLADLKKPLPAFMASLGGSVGLNENGASLHFSMQPNGVSTKAKIQGFYTDGKAEFPDFDIALQELSFNFDYDLQSGLLSCSNIQGTLLAGSSEDADEYMLVGDYVRFNDYAQQQAQFDLWVGDKNRDILRLVGSSFPVSISDPKNGTEISLDSKLSHFGSMHPDPYFSLIVKDWSEIESLYLKFGFQLDTMLNDIQRFGKTGLLFLSQGLLKELNAKKSAQGDFDVTFRYEQDSDRLSYDVYGNDVSIGSYQYKKCLLYGKKSGNKWNIEQLKLDDLSFAADVTKTDKELAFDFIGIRYGSYGLLGLEGKYSLENRQFNGKINLLETNLKDLSALPKLQHLLTYHLKGDVRATGNIHAEWLDHKPTWQWKVEMNAALRKGELEGIKFQDIENIKCSYASNEGLFLNQICTSIKDQNNKTHGLISLEKLEYQPSSQTFNVSGLDFDISPKYLSENANFLLKFVFGQSYHKPSRFLSNINLDGNLGGTLNLTRSPVHTLLSLKFKEGHYQHENEVYDLCNTVIECDPYELRVNTECLYKERPYQVSLQSKLPVMETGEVCIDDKISKNPLKIYWQSNRNEEIEIGEIQGTCSGITFNLCRPRESFDKRTHLIGNVFVEAIENSSVIEQFDALKPLNLKGKYYFTGEVFIENVNLLNWSKLVEKMHFKGGFEILHCGLNGFEFDNLSGDLEYVPETILGQNFSIKDSAGAFYAKNISFGQDEQKNWIITIPSASMTRFTPSSLRGLNPTLYAKHTNFSIGHLELKDFSGSLFRPETYKGKGTAYCQNPSHQGSDNHSTSLASQLEKETNLDVELALLRPVCGTVHYEMDQGKIFLTLLEDVYSCGKHSKFYLCEDAERSYLDFNGNLSIQARIKQRNLLIKFAELFTVSISGSLVDPVYSFSRNKKRDL